MENMEDINYISLDNLNDEVIEEICKKGEYTYEI